jgi:hypothetical protein
MMKGMSASEPRRSVTVEIMRRPFLQCVGQDGAGDSLLSYREALNLSLGTHSPRYPIF